MNPYISLLMLFAVAGLMGGTILVLSHLLGPRKKGVEKGMSYECGINSGKGSRERLSVKFYLVAMLFILFDVEVVFLYPWAVLYRDFIRAGSGLFVLIEMLVFLGILVVGLLYIYGRKALRWE